MSFAMAGSWLRHVCRLVLIAALLVCPVRGALAATTILSTGFESPFMPGNLVDQFGWKTAGVGTSSATVKAGVGVSNSQAVEVVKAASSDRRWAVPHQMGYPSQRFVTVDWDMRVSQAPDSTGFGPFFGVDTYDDTTGAPFVLGSLGVDSSTGDVLFQEQDSGVLKETGIQVSFGQWNHYRIVLDFATDTYTALVNGTVRATTGFVDRQNGLNEFTDADLATFAAAPDGVSQGLVSSAFYDNFLVRDGLAGDYDIDGDVDNADYGVWRAAFGSTVATPGHNADGNGNGVVDAADYVAWRNNLGANLFSGVAVGAAAAVSSGLSAVPEPTSGFLAICCVTLAAPAVAVRRRRRTLD